jgi:hypothetical protein
MMYDDAEIERFRTGALALDIPGINKLATAAGWLCYPGTLASRAILKGN